MLIFRELLETVFVARTINGPFTGKSANTELLFEFKFFEGHNFVHFENEVAENNKRL
jgi:hypothetical protein